MVHIQMPDTVKYQARRLSEITGCDYMHALQNLRSGASFNELLDFYKDDQKPLVDDYRNI